MEENITNTNACGDHLDASSEKEVAEILGEAMKMQLELVEVERQKVAQSRKTVARAREKLKQARIEQLNEVHGVRWTAVIITCQGKNSALAYQKELELFQKKGRIASNTLLLAIEDPKFRVGSGGATLNALLIVAEHLSALMGYAVVNTDVLHNSHILLLHTGREFPFDPCGRAFVNIPAEFPQSHTTGCHDLVYNIHTLIHTITYKVGVDSPPGVWVSSTDMLLTVPDPIKINWTSLNGGGACVIAVPASPDYAKNHGVYKINKQGVVEDIVFQGTKSAIAQCTFENGTVPLACGIVYLSTRVVEKMVSLHVQPPMDACTYLALDTGVTPIELSLFFDFLLCMAKGVEYKEYVSGRQSRPASTHQQDETTLNRLRSARALLWEKLREFELRAVCVENSSHNYLSLSSADFHRNLINCPLKTKDDIYFEFNNQIHSYVQDSVSVDKGCVIINSVIEGTIQLNKNTVVLNSHLTGDFIVGKDSILSCIDQKASKAMQGVTLPDNIFLTGFNIQLGKGTTARPTKIFTAVGKFDSSLVNLHQRNFKPSFVKGKNTFCNSPWVFFLNRSGVNKEDLWPTYESDYDLNLFNAKLFPVWHCQEDVGMKEVLWLLDLVSSEKIQQNWKDAWRISIEDILKCSDITRELEWRRELYTLIVQKEIERTLVNKVNQSLLPYFKSSVLEGFWDSVLKTLDKVLLSSGPEPGVCARTLACIADVLGCLGHYKGSYGLRSGPAANKAWKPAFQHLEEGHLEDGVRVLSSERENWIDRGDLCIRAARHYEGAAQILIRHAVKTARKFIQIRPRELLPFKQWVTARCPARIDLSGAWTDTPPITYEHGGTVVSVALLVDGKKPIGARVRRIEEPYLVLTQGTDPETRIELVCKELCDLEDYTNPQSTGALLKAAFCCADIISLPSSLSLKEQLTSKYHGGFEVHTWSDLPYGSGLGASSILAGGVLAALWTASGHTYDNDSLIHAVLHLEQMLTTGGGWQDQVGGLLPGAKIAHSKPELPLRVDAKKIEASPEAVEKFNRHLAFIYTGKTRLARNLLQDVVRNWYARAPHIVNNCDALVDTAQECAQAFLQADIERIGDCINTFWSQKKVMAPGSEPASVRRMMDALRPHVYGQALAGAGGGGFIYALTKEPDYNDSIREILGQLEGLMSARVHSATICNEGLDVTIGAEE